MPSLGEWYGKISEALHEANEDDALFNKALAEIDHHFDIRRVFKIADTNPESVQQNAQGSGRE